MRVLPLALGLVFLSGCSPDTGDASREPAPLPALERSTDELEPADPPPSAEASGGFTAAAHEQALRLRANEPARAVEMLEGGCDRGFAPSCLALADMLEAGRGVEADPEAARAVLEQACFSTESTEACDRLGH